MPQKILIVEDDAINVKFMKVLYSPARVATRVLVSEDVEEIVQLAATGAVDAIIMDISLSRSSYEGRESGWHLHHPAPQVETRDGPRSR